MSDGPDRDSVPPWIDHGPRPEDGGPGPRLEAVPNGASDTVTFVPATADTDEVTTAWMTVDSAVVFDAAEMR